MDELYVQNFGKKNVVSLIGWNRDRALVLDLHTGLKCTYDWNLFFKYHDKLEDNEFDIKEYTGSDLSAVL